MGDQQPEMFTVQLTRRDSGVSWGFRLQGGVDFNTPLSVQVVQPKSVSERCGLRPGDGIIRINNANTDELSHEQAKMEIIRSCNDLELTVIRGAVQIWRPKVKKISEMKPQEMQPIKTATGEEMYTSQKTSLAKENPDETCTIGSSYNRSAKPFTGFGAQSQQAKQPQQPQYGGGQPQFSPPQQPQYGGGQPQFSPPQQPQYGGGQPQYSPPQQPQYGGGQPQYSSPQQPQYGGGQPQYGGGQPQYGGGQPQYGGRKPKYGGGPQFGGQPGSPKRAVPNVVHAQFNSPIGLYSADNIAHTYSAQTEGINQEVQGLDVSSEAVGSRMTGTYQRLDSDQGSTPTSPTGAPPGDEVDPTQLTHDMSMCDVNDRLQPTDDNNSLPPPSDVSPIPLHVTIETSQTLNSDNKSPESPGGGGGFKSVRAPTGPAPGTAPSAPKQESMHCNGCSNLVTGVFVRVKGLPYHEKCFKCFNCGLFLKQKGYFMIEGQLYCETHARRAAQAPGDDMKFAGAVYR